MWLNLLIIIGTCFAVIIVGYAVYWIINERKKILRANQSNAMSGGRQNSLTIAEDIQDSSSEQPQNEVNLVPDIQSKTDIKTEDGEWLNNRIPEVSARTIHQEDDDWLNAGIEEIPTQDYKKQDDDWLNAENNKSLETLNEFSLLDADTSSPEIQIRQEGPMLNITIMKANKRDTKPEQTVINLKINVSPQDSAEKDQEVYDVEVTPSYQGLEDIMTVKPVEESVYLSNALMDEISVRHLGNPVIESQDADSQAS